ncbi:translation initiation factor IF-2-like [Moschus berezovskii]|uniref:translation initiation factor IF-2-like n=1 Tax=Moschus berezovskii TaxID=68408 RepID=UPI00244399C3|nr:translation initiation factor IF-2-like [Moschus berezovskii]
MGGSGRTGLGHGGPLQPGVPGLARALPRPPFLFRLVEGHRPSCSPHTVACQGCTACLGAQLDCLGTNHGSSPYRPPLPRAPSRAATPQAWGCWPAPPRTPGAGTPSPRGACAPGCVTAVRLRRGPCPRAQRPRPVSPYFPGEASCAPVPSRREKQGGGGRGGDRAVRKKEKGFFCFCAQAEALRQVALYGIHHETLQPPEGRVCEPQVRGPRWRMRARVEGQRVCGQLHWKQDKRRGSSRPRN